jgi:dsRNA-specific ribonuclease
MLILERAFTHPSVDPVENYEFYEFIGDVTVNKCIVWHAHRRFPHLRTVKGVEIISQLKSNLVSRKSLSSFADKLDFWKYIRMTSEIQERHKKKVLEDVFEAFIGALEMIIDDCVNPHSGYGVCYTIIDSILSNIKISLATIDLKDSKTRLKELFDKNPNLKNLKYIVTSNRNGVNTMFEISATGIVNNQLITMGYGSAYIKKDAEKKAATTALKWLESQNIVALSCDSPTYSPTH